MSSRAQSTTIPRIRGLLASPRFQRRFLWVSLLVFVAGAVAVAIVVIHGTSDAFKTPISTIPAQLEHKEKTVPVSPAAIEVARKFIKTAVDRKNLDTAYDLVHVNLRGRMSRKEWDTGNIPVIGYPARNADTAAFVTDYSYETSALFEVDLVARRGSGVRPHLLFYIGLKREGGSKTGRWLVSYWEPHWRPPVPTQ